MTKKELHLYIQNRDNIINAQQLVKIASEMIIKVVDESHTNYDGAYELYTALNDMEDRFEELFAKNRDLYLT